MYCVSTNRTGYTPLFGLLDRRHFALPHRLERDPSERRVHFLAHALLLPADGLQVATGRLQVRVAEPELHRPHVHSREQVHARERVAEFVEVELLADRVLLAGDWLPEVLRVAVPAIQLTT